ncbi:hypothetical protein FALCPG4_002083 [Fusarium falciforme]
MASDLPQVQRYITTHDASGNSIIDQSIPTAAPWYSLPDNSAIFAQCYATRGFPVNLSGDKDLQQYREFLDDAPGLVVSNGTVLRYVDIGPNVTSPIHRTVSVDFGLVLEGEAELILDSGETRILKRGDVCVQRATMHAWRNTSNTSSARLLFVLQPARPFKIGGEDAKEDYGGMAGVKASS